MGWWAAGKGEFIIMLNKLGFFKNFFKESDNYWFIFPERIDRGSVMIVPYDKYVQERQLLTFATNEQEKYQMMTITYVFNDGERYTG